MRTARALIVMPFSRSRSVESSTCSAISRALRVCVRSSKRSASVDLPWSMCAIMQKLRMNCWFMPRQQSAVTFQYAGRRLTAHYFGDSKGADTSVRPRIDALFLQYSNRLAVRVRGSDLPTNIPSSRTDTTWDGPYVMSALLALNGHPSDPEHV